MNMLKTAPRHFSLALILALSSSGAAFAGDGNGPSCTQVCKHLDSVCSLAAAGCSLVCMGTAASERTCLLNAKDCDQVDQCANSDGAQPPPSAKPQRQEKKSSAPSLSGTWHRNAGSSKVDAALEFSGSGECKSQEVEKSTGKKVESLEQECTYTQSGNQLEIEYSSGICEGIRGRYEIRVSSGELRFQVIEDDCDGRRMELTGGAWTH